MKKLKSIGTYIVMKHKKLYKKNAPELVLLNVSMYIGNIFNALSYTYISTIYG